LLPRGKRGEKISEGHISNGVRSGSLNGNSLYEERGSFFIPGPDGKKEKKKKETGPPIHILHPQERGQKSRRGAPAEETQVEP